MIPQGIVGAVIGRALYDQAFTFPEVVAAVEPRIDLWTWGPPQP